MVKTKWKKRVEGKGKRWFGSLHLQELTPTPDQQRRHLTCDWSTLEYWPRVMFSAEDAGVVVSTNLVVVSATWDATMSSLTGHLVFSLNFNHCTVWYLRNSVCMRSVMWFIHYFNNKSVRGKWSGLIDLMCSITACMCHCLLTNTKGNNRVCICISKTNCVWGSERDCEYNIASTVGHLFIVLPLTQEQFLNRK